MHVSPPGSSAGADDSTSAVESANAYIASESLSSAAPSQGLAAAASGGPHSVQGKIRDQISRSRTVRGRLEGPGGTTHAGRAGEPGPGTLQLSTESPFKFKLASRRGSGDSVDVVSSVTFQGSAAGAAAAASSSKLSTAALTRALQADGLPLANVVSVSAKVVGPSTVLAAATKASTPAATSGASSITCVPGLAGAMYTAVPAAVAPDSPEGS